VESPPASSCKLAASVSSQCGVPDEIVDCVEDGVRANASLPSRVLSRRADSAALARPRIPWRVARRGPRSPLEALVASATLHSTTWKNLQSERLGTRQFEEEMSAISRVNRCSDRSQLAGSAPLSKIRRRARKLMSQLRPCPEPSQSSATTT
jgi:hypothetical protein